MDAAAHIRKHGLVLFKHSLLLFAQRLTLLDGQGADVLGARAEDFVNEAYDVNHILLHEAARGDGRGADAETGSLERTAGVEWNHILVESDIGKNELLLCHTAGHLFELAAKVNEHKVVVGTAADYLVAPAEELGAHSLGVGDDLGLVFYIFRLLSLIESDCLCGDHVLERTTLDTRED